MNFKGLPNSFTHRLCSWKLLPQRMRTPQQEPTALTSMINGMKARREVQWFGSIRRQCFKVQELGIETMKQAREDGMEVDLDFQEGGMNPTSISRCLDVQ